MNIDEQLFLIINNLAGSNGAVDWFFIFCARYLILVLLAFLIIFILAYNKKSKKTYDLILAWNAVLGIILGLVFNYFLSLIFDRMRPFDAGLGTNIYGEAITTGSFPSEHTMIAFAIAASIYLVHKKSGLVAFAFAFLVGFSRIYVGVHYPLDIIVGAFVGVGMAYLAAKVVTPKFLEIKKKKKL